MATRARHYAPDLICFAADVVTCFDARCALPLFYLPRRHLDFFLRLRRHTIRAIIRAVAVAFCHACRKL